MEGEGLWEGEWYPITNIKIENQHRRIVEISPKSWLSVSKWTAYLVMMIERKLNINGGHSFGDGTEPYSL